MSQKDNKYKDTINLPKTGFPMKGNLAQREPETLKFWQDMNLYGRLRDERKGADKYVTMARLMPMVTSILGMPLTRF